MLLSPTGLSLNPMLTLTQQATLVLWQLVNLSVTSYAKLLTAFHTPTQAIATSLSDWQALNLHASHLQRFSDYIQAGRHSTFLAITLQQLAQGEYQVVFYDEPSYPALLKQLYDPPPVLFYQGNVQALSMPQLAIVGSRKPTPHASKITFDMAQFLAYEGLWITSGLAEGIDSQAHQGALAQNESNKQGRTVAVLGNGIRLCYPKHHQGLKQQIIANGGCVVSELLPDMPSNKHHFPRRNRLVAGLSLGTLVVEAALQSGSLITAKCANDQGKQVFAIPSHIDNHNAKGCHQLIREGATLIDHPQQILEDLSVFQSPFADNHPGVIERTTTKVVSSQPITKSEANLSTDSAAITNVSVAPDFSQALPTNLPAHLLQLLNQLDWVGQDMDALVERSGLDIATLTGYLVELELMGHIMQHGGRYLRCRT